MQHFSRAFPQCLLPWPLDHHQIPMALTLSVAPFLPTMLPRWRTQNEGNNSIFPVAGTLLSSVKLLGRFFKSKLVTAAHDHEYGNFSQVPIDCSPRDPADRINHCRNLGFYQTCPSIPRSRTFQVAGERFLSGGISPPAGSHGGSASMTVPGEGGVSNICQPQTVAKH